MALERREHIQETGLADRLDMGLGGEEEMESRTRDIYAGAAACWCGPI